MSTAGGVDYGNVFEDIDVSLGAVVVCSSIASSMSFIILLTYSLTSLKFFFTVCHIAS